MAQSQGKLNSRAGVIICGAYGMGNAGDEAILRAIIGELRKIDSELPITVLSRRPEETASHHRVKAIFTFDMPRIYAEMRKARLFISGGGSLIQDATSSRSLWYYLHTIKAAKKRGCRVMMYGCGVGPVTRGGNAAKAGQIIDRYVDKVTLRESDSLEVLSSWGVKRPEITLSSDPVIALPLPAEETINEEMKRLGLSPDGRYAAFCLRSWSGFEEAAPAFGEAADYVFQKYGLTPVFLSINHRSDGEAAARAAAFMRTGGYVTIQEPMPTSVAMGVMSRMEICVSIRLHGLIFAAASGVPSVGVSYDPKVSAFMNYLGAGSCISLDGVTGTGLQSMIDKALQCSRESLRASAEALREKESLNALSAASLLEEEKE